MNLEMMNLEFTNAPCDEKKWSDETVCKSYIERLNIGPGKYKSGYIYIEGHRDMFTGVETTLFVNSQPVIPVNSGNATNWDEVKGTSNRSYYYDFTPFAEKDLMIEVRGYITSKNVFTGGGADITMKCIKNA